MRKDFETTKIAPSVLQQRRGERRDPELTLDRES